MISGSVRPQAEQNADLVVEDNMISGSVRPQAEQNADLHSCLVSDINWPECGVSSIINIVSY